MAPEELIPAADFCTHYRIQLSFLQSLQDYGLVEMHTVQERTYLRPEQVAAVERFMHLHYDLDVNFEGLDVVHHVLQRVEAMRQEMNALKTRLRFYEEQA